MKKNTKKLVRAYYCEHYIVKLYVNEKTKRYYLFKKAKCPDGQVILERNNMQDIEAYATYKLIVEPLLY